MLESARFTEIPRRRTDLSIDSDLLAWLEPHLRPGGPFGSPSHAAERALHRLQTEAKFLQDACKTAGIPFRVAAYWKLYAEEVAQTLPDRVRHGQGSRRRVYASIAVDLIEWADKTCIQKGPFTQLSQVVEVGLRSLRMGVHRPEPGSLGDGLSRKPEALWKLYQDLAHEK